MLANVDLIISAVAVVAVCSAQPFKSCCWDLALFFIAIGGYALLAKRFKVKVVPTAKLPKEIPREHIVTESITTSLEPEAPSAQAVEDDVHTEPLDSGNHLAMMRRYASERNISGAMRIFRLVKQSGGPLSSAMYSTVLQAWISCGNVPAAEDWLEEMKAAGTADATSYDMLIRALVTARCLQKVFPLIHQMKCASLQPSTTTLNLILNGCAQDGFFVDGISLLAEWCTQEAQPDPSTIQAVVRLMNSARTIDVENSQSAIKSVLNKCKLEEQLHHRCFQPPIFSEQVECDSASKRLLVPPLVSVIQDAERTAAKFQQHEVRITGRAARVKAARKTLKQHGFLDRHSDTAWPLDGHWETGHGLIVIIEGKVVRWSRQRASRLKLGPDRKSCVLMLYGTQTQGQLLTPGTAPGATKTLSWANGDIWHSYDEHIIGQSSLHSQSMTKMLRDTTHDEIYRARTHAVIHQTSRGGLGLPATVIDTVVQFLGGDLYYIRIHFATSSWHPPSQEHDGTEDQDMLSSLSQRNPRVGFRHCWVQRREYLSDLIGQRTLVNGEEVDEEEFTRHIQAAWPA
jgi:hypothetical protein